MPKITFIVPYRSDGGPRERAFLWVLPYLKHSFPDEQICVATPSGRLFNRSRAINQAYREAKGDVLVIVDSDALFAPRTIHESLRYVDECGMVVPFRFVVNMPRDRTEALYLTTPAWPPGISLSGMKLERQEERFAGRLNVITRRNFEKAGGFDERFDGYGGEDRSFMNTVVTLCGPMLRLDDPIFHLWHPHSGYAKNPNAAFNKKLRQRYEVARGDSEAIKKIVQERGRCTVT